MASRRRHLHRRRSFNGGRPIAIRVGSRRSPHRFHEIQANSPKDAGRFARVVEDQVRAFPREPLIIAVNGYQPWLEDIFNSCLRDYWSDISDVDREVQFANTMQFPERSAPLGRSQQDDLVPWSFIVNQMNVPQVYYWTVDLEPPPGDDLGLPYIDNFRFRVGAWQMGRGACLVDHNVSVTIIFTKPTEVSEHVVTEVMFGFIYKDRDLSQPREDEEGICWIFLRLYWLLTDWQNIILAVKTRLKEAEQNSHGRKLPVKMRARSMHHEIDRIYEVKEYLQFHETSFKKLQKLKDDVPKQEQDDQLWNDMDDAVNDLDQFSSTLDGLKERFSNLLDLEFNIQNAVQSDNSNFLSIVATLFLPVSFLSGVFGITTITWPPIWYLWASIPVLVVSIIFTLFFKKVVNWVQKQLYPIEDRRIVLQPQDFTMLGDELPGTTELSGSLAGARTSRRRSSRPERDDGPPRQRPRSRSRARSEKEH